jgi:hypothetical protein
MPISSELIHHPDGGCSTHSCNICLLQRNYTALFLRRPTSWMDTCYHWDHVLLPEVARTGYKAITISWRRYIYLWLLNFYQWPSLYDAITSRRNTTAFWDIAPCSKIEVDRRFRGVYWLHHQNDPNDNFCPPLKRRSTSILLHGATSQKFVVILLSS